MWASAFRAASCPEFTLIVKAVDDSMSSTAQLLLDNLAHVLKHQPQRNFRLRVLLDLCYVDEQKVRLVMLEASAAMIVFVSVAIIEPALKVQHVVIMLPQKAYISMYVTGVYHPACLIIRAKSGWRFSGLDGMTREDLAWTVRLDGLPREDV